MNEQATAHAIQADKHSWGRLGSLPACLALDCADIGEAKINGNKVLVTWGRNLNAKQQEWYAENTSYQLIRLGADDGSCEIVIPREDAVALWPLVRR